ncbi:hypothetical protein CRYUN_Cryun21dG0084600 [Craigia yunnanensis]
MEPHKPSFLKWYDPNSHCYYHYGAQDHSTENCWPLKYKVQSLIKAGWLDFNKNSGPNVTAYPLPNHIGPIINVVIKEPRRKIKVKVTKVKSSNDKVCVDTSFYPGYHESI